MIPFPEKKYSVIYADPPWNYAAGGKTRNVERHYRTMKPEDIYSLPVQDIAEDDCLLFLWATFPNLDVALETIRRWGFQYKTAAFVWVKRNRKSPSWFWGLGNWTRANAEICLLATKGKTDIINNAVNSNGLLSKRTILQNHPWVTDVDEELARIDEEKKAAMEEYGDGLFNHAMGADDSQEGGDSAGLNGGDGNDE